VGGFCFVGLFSPPIHKKGEKRKRHEVVENVGRAW
jgi:hypothetical protein